MTRVLIADDDDLMRAGLVELLTADATIEVAGQAATGRQAVEGAHRLAPDVVLMDVRMPDLDGIEATRMLTREAPEVKVLILTTFEQDDYVFGALRAGASGFLLKRTRPEELIAAVHTIAEGDCLLSPSVTRRVIDRMAQQPTPDLTGHAGLDALTAREREVIELVGAGLGALIANLTWTQIEGDPHPFVVVLFSVAGALLATWLQRYVIILGTAFGGAWTLIVGGLAFMGDKTAMDAAARSASRKPTARGPMSFCAPMRGR